MTDLALYPLPSVAFTLIIVLPHFETPCGPPPPETGAGDASGGGGGGGSAEGAAAAAAPCEPGTQAAPLAEPGESWGRQPVQALYQAMDRDDNARVSFDESETFGKALTWQRLDADGDGECSNDEFAGALRSLGPRAEAVAQVSLMLPLMPALMLTSDAPSGAPSGAVLWCCPLMRPEAGCPGALLRARHQRRHGAVAARAAHRDGCDPAPRQGATGKQ